MESIEYGNFKLSISISYKLSWSTPPMVGFKAKNSLAWYFDTPKPWKEMGNKLGYYDINRLDVITNWDILA